MKRLLPLALLLATAAAPPANVQMQNGLPRGVTPVASVDGAGQQLGTSDNPMYVTGGTGGSSTATPTGSAGSPNAQVVTVQGISGGTPQNVNVTASVLPTGAATAANQPGVATTGSAAPTTGTQWMLFDGTNAQRVRDIGSSNATTGAGLLGVGVTGWDGTNYRRMSTVSGADSAGATVQAVSEVPTSGAAESLSPLTAQGATSLLLKSSAGNLFSVNIVNSTAAGFLVVANLAAVPASGTAISAAQQLYCMPIAANAGLRDRFDIPFRGSVGLVMLASTSCTTYTPLGTAPISMTGAAL